MRNSNEISAALNDKMVAMNAETDAAKREALVAEVRALTNELQEAQIDEAAKRALANQRVLTPAEEKDVKRFSISKFLREAASGKGLTGVEAEMDQEARKERSIEGFGIPAFLLRTGDFNNATDSGYGPEFKAVTKWAYVEALRNNLVAAKAGATILNSLQGNFTMVKGGNVAASWLTEESAASVTKPGFSAITMSPKRLQILAGYTHDLLKQSALSVDSIIWNELAVGHAQALDSAAFNGAALSGETPTGQPNGIRNTANINTVAGGAAGAAMSFANLVKMETEVAADNGLRGSLCYVTNSKVMGKLKTTAQIEGYPAYLFQDGKANGYDVLVSNAIPSNLTKSTGSGLSSMIFGNFNDLIIAGWGGLDVLVDPYTSKNKGVIEVTMLAYHDIAVRHPESFCVCDDIVTA